MNQLDWIPKEILNYWKTFETPEIIIQWSLVDDFKDRYIFFLGSRKNFSPTKVFAVGNQDTIVYYWYYDEINNEQFSEKDFIKLLKLKAFI